MKLVDDGQALTIDLHGATITSASGIIHRALHAGFRKGRSSIRFIHGSSTTHVHSERMTLKRLVHQIIESESLRSMITGSYKSDDYTIVSLPFKTTKDTTPIRLADVV